jgi:hypothetical protein
LAASKLEIYGARTGAAQLSNAALAAAGGLNLTTGLTNSTTLIETGLVAGLALR